MLQRPKFPKIKDVTLIVDVPNRIEIENEEPYSSASNLNLLTSLRTGKVNVWNKETTQGFVGINSLDIFKTYLDYSYYGEGDVEANFDFNKEFKKKKDLIAEKVINESGEEVRFFDAEDTTSEYHLIPHQKDLYISSRLYKQFTALLTEIRTTKPKLIIVTGKWSLFFLTGLLTYAQTAGNPKDRKPLGGLVKYRSSVMKLHECFGEFEHNPILVPIYHPVHASGMPDKQPIMEIDIQKLAYRYSMIKEYGTKFFLEPDKEYMLGTTKEVVLNELAKIKAELDLKPTLVSMDVECFFLSIIDCIGVTTSKDSGICIPFCIVGNPNYWSLEDEVDIMVALREVMLHPNAQHIGQNYQFDCQMYYFNWLLNINGTHDTMVLHHILYNYLPKDLAFLASIYCTYYSYWKDEIDASATTPEVRWTYNIKDIQYTLEVLEQLLGVLHREDQKLIDLYYFQQQRLSPVLVNMMQRGVRIDIEEKERLYKFFKTLMTDIEAKINDVLGFEFNQNSTPQKKKLFKEFFGITLNVKKRGGAETCDASAMLDYIQKYPMYRPFLTLLLEYASLKVFVNNFLGMSLDDDNRARTQYRIAGTATGRLASTKNVRGKGGNFMNIPEKGKINLKYALETVEEGDIEDGEFEDIIIEGSIVLPNVKKIFLPDEDKEIADWDLSGADIQIVAWDSECKWLMDYFANPRGNGKVYHYIASDFFQKEITDREYKIYKSVFHGINYGMQIAKLAATARISEYLAEQLMKFYFSLNPEVKKWQERIERDIKSRGFITNVFGRRAWFLNRNDVTLLNKAFAFIPQSSIADVMNHALVDVYENHRNFIDILLQVHDSGVFQYDKRSAEESRKIIKQCMEVVVPYDKPLIIPSDCKVSTVSYGDTEKVKKIVMPVDARVFNIEEKNKLEILR